MQSLRSARLAPAFVGRSISRERISRIETIGSSRPGTGSVNLQVIIVMNYPKHINSFYMWMNDDGRLAPGIDVIIGGSQSEERL